MGEFVWTPTSPLHRPLVSGPLGTAVPQPGVRLTERTGFGLLQIMARRGRWAQTAAAAHRFYGVEPPPRLAAAFGRDVILVWSGADQFLALSQTNHWPVDAVRSVFGGAASVSEQSDSRCLVRLSGPHVRDALAKICSLDLHAEAFPVGVAAATLIDHTAVNLWRERDAGDGGAVFSLLMFTSFAESIWHTILVATAEYGLEING